MSWLIGGKKKENDQISLDKAFKKKKTAKAAWQREDHNEGFDIVVYITLQPPEVVLQALDDH